MPAPASCPDTPHAAGLSCPLSGGLRVPHLMGCRPPEWPEALQADLAEALT